MPHPGPPDASRIASIGEIARYLRSAPDALDYVLKNWGSLMARLAMLRIALEDRLAELRPKNYPPVVFIAYKWEDASHQAWVRRLAAHLRSRGWQVLLDQDHLERDASNFREVPAYISRLVECDRFLAVVTERYLDLVEERQSQTSWVFDEYEVARRLHMAGKLRIQAVWKEAAAPPTKLLLRMDAIDLRGDPERFEGLDAAFPVYDGPQLDARQRADLLGFMQRFDAEFAADPPDIDALRQLLENYGAFEALYDYRLRLARVYWRAGKIDAAYPLALAIRDECDDDEDILLLAQILDAAGDHPAMFRFLYRARCRMHLQGSVTYHYFVAETLRERNSVVAALNHFRWLHRSPAFGRLPAHLRDDIDTAMRELGALAHGPKPDHRFRCTECAAEYFHLGSLKHVCGDCGTLYEGPATRCPVCDNDGRVPLHLLLRAAKPVPVAIECPICNDGRLERIA